MTYFHDNRCGENGAGFYIDGGAEHGSEAVLTHVTITGNTCPDGVNGSGFFAEGGSRIDLVDSIVAGNGETSDTGSARTVKPHHRPTRASSATAWSARPMGRLTSATEHSTADPASPTPRAATSAWPRAARARARRRTDSDLGALRRCAVSRGRLGGAAAVAVLLVLSGCGDDGGDDGGGRQEEERRSGGGDRDKPTALADVWDGSCDGEAAGEVYDVGPDEELGSIAEVPWSRLGPGDRVRIPLPPRALPGEDPDLRAGHPREADHRVRRFGRRQPAGHRRQRCDHGQTHALGLRRDAEPRPHHFRDQGG